MNSHPSPSPRELREGPPPLARFTEFLASKDRVSRLALSVAAGSLLVATMGVGFAAYSSQRPILFVAIDPNGNWIPVAGSTFPEARELHVKEAMLATTALLSRNPRDFDQPEFIQAMFSKTAITSALRIKAAEAKEFSSRQIQQKPQISRIEAVSNHRDEVQVQVVGEVDRWGLDQQSQFTDSFPFTLRLVLRNNPDLIRQRQQPLVVDSFTLTYASPKTN